MDGAGGILVLFINYIHLSSIICVLFLVASNNDSYSSPWLRTLHSSIYNKQLASWVTLLPWMDQLFLGNVGVTLSLASKYNGI